MGPKVGDIRQQDGDLHHVREGVVRLLQDSADVFQALLGLALDILGGEFAGSRIDGQTSSGDVEGLPALMAWE